MLTDRQPNAFGRATLETGRIPTAWLALAGIVGPLLFIVSALTAGFLRPGYSFLAQGISELGVGTNAWILNVALVTCGLLVIVFAIGFYQLLPNLRRRGLITTLLIIFGVCFATAGVFTLPDPNGPMTVGGVIHFLVGFFIGMPVLTVALFIAGWGLRKLPDWNAYGRYTITSGLLMAVFFLLTSVINNPSTPFQALGLGGLAEWLLFLTFFAWFMVTGGRLFGSNCQS